MSSLLKIAVAVGILATVLVGAPMPSSSAATVPGHRIKAVHEKDGSELCLDVPANNAFPGQKLVVWTCNRDLTRSQAFEFRGTEIVHVDSGLCLDVKHNGTQNPNGSEVILWPHCDGRNNQQWRARGFTIESDLKAGLCLDMRGGWASVRKGTEITVWTCHGGKNQAWQIFQDIENLTLLSDGRQRTATTTFLGRPGPAVDCGGQNIVFGELTIFYVAMANRLQILRIDFKNFGRDPVGVTYVSTSWSDGGRIELRPRELPMGRIGQLVEYFTDDTVTFETSFLGGESIAIDFIQPGKNHFCFNQIGLFFDK